MLAGVCSTLLLCAIGCDSNKQKTTTEPPATSTVEEADTSFSEPEPFADVDTSDEAVFEEASLEEALEQKIKEILVPVYFEYNSYQLSTESIDKLVQISSFLLENNTMRILIEGHCDERGSAEYNIGLGERRAKSIKDYLTNFGVPAIQLEITSWGKENPVNPNCFDEVCHSENRRAEFKVLAR